MVSLKSEQWLPPLPALFRLAPVMLPRFRALSAWLNNLLIQLLSHGTQERISSSTELTSTTRSTVQSPITNQATTRASERTSEKHWLKCLLEPSMDTMLSSRLMSVICSSTESNDFARRIVDFNQAHWKISP